MGDQLGIHCLQSDPQEANTLFSSVVMVWGIWVWSFRSGLIHLECDSERGNLSISCGTKSLREVWAGGSVSDSLIAESFPER